jgi:PhoH-like ATPase
LTKRFLLDTNILLHDANCLEVFADNEVIIPISVLDELDQAKIRPDEAGRNARSIIRRLDELRSLGSLSGGARLPSGSLVRVELNHRATLPSTLSDSVDNRLIRTAIGLRDDGSGLPVILVTKDINLRVKCDALGITAQDYERDKFAKAPSALYSGFETLDVPSATIDELYSRRIVDVDIAERHPNKFVLLRSVEREGHSGIGRLTVEGRLRAANLPSGAWGIVPRNLEQRMALALLLDPGVKLVTLVGRAGSGKTLMAAAAALHQIVETRVFQRALLSRPVQPLGRDIGFLPGTVEEKLAPWMAALNDSLELLFSKDIGMLDTYKRQGVIKVEPLTYIRGRSIPNSLMIIDESQNLTTHEIKTIITRIGDGSKIVLTGDLEQIDNPFVDFASNGLTNAIERLKGHGITGHVTLRKCERSELAELAAEIL